MLFFTFSYETRTIISVSYVDNIRNLKIIILTLSLFITNDYIILKFARFTLFVDLVPC